MKKILLFAVATAVALSSCSKNEIAETPDSLKSEISFAPYVGTTTKATAVDKTNFIGFKLNAYLHDATTNPAGVAHIADADFTVSYSTANYGDFVAASGDTYYWPSAGTLDFYGYVADSKITYGEPTYASGIIDAEATLTYTASTTMTDQIDVVVADVISKNCVADSGSDVELPFKHLLTQIQFSAKGDNNAFDYHIKSITIEGAESTGVYTWGTTNTWAAPTTAATYTYCSNSAVADYQLVDGTTSEAVDVASGDGTLMLIPQSVDGIAIKVEYIVTDADKTNPIMECIGSDAKTVTLSSSDVAWEKGKSIVYNLTLVSTAVKPINIKASLTDWVAETAQDKTVQ